MIVTHGWRHFPLGCCLQREKAFFITFISLSLHSITTIDLTYLTDFPGCDFTQLLITVWPIKNGQPRRFPISLFPITPSSLSKFQDRRNGFPIPDLGCQLPMTLDVYYIFDVRIGRLDKLPCSWAQFISFFM